MGLQTLLSNVTANGPGAVLDCTGQKKAVLLISGTFNANVSFEASLDGVTYFSFSGKPNGGKALAAVVAAPGYVEFDVGGVAYLRPLVSRYENGSISVVGYTEVERESAVGSNALIYDGTASWADSAGAGTEVDLDVVLPDSLQGQALYLVTVHNPSAVTGLSVTVKGKETLGGAAVYSELTSFVVGADSSKQVLVQGWLLGEGGRLTLSNDTALGATDGFIAYIRVRQV